MNIASVLVLGAGLAHGYAPAQLSQASRRRLPAASPQCVLNEVDDACLLDERCIHFVTGNAKKELEVNVILGDENLEPFRVVHVDIDLPELQGDAMDIAREKCREAARRVGGACIIEDTSLCFNALNGLPGPYIKWFVDQLGNDGLYRLLAAHEDKTAYCQCALAFSAGPDAEPVLFVGRTHGVIVEPCGTSGFGWDAIFIPETKEVPFGAMPLAEKNQLSHRARALAKFVAYVKQNQDAVFDAISNGGRGLEAEQAK